MEHLLPSKCKGASSCNQERIGNEACMAVWAGESDESDDPATFDQCGCTGA